MLEYACNRDSSRWLYAALFIKLRDIIHVHAAQYKDARETEYNDVEQRALFILGGECFV